MRQPTSIQQAALKRLEQTAGARARDLANAELLAARHGYVLAPTGDPSEPGAIAP
jgi:hypothetical protein